MLRVNYTQGPLAISNQPFHNTLDLSRAVNSYAYREGVYPWTIEYVGDSLLPTATGCSGDDSLSKRYIDSDAVLAAAGLRVPIFGQTFSDVL